MFLYNNYRSVGGEITVSFHAYFTKVGQYSRIIDFGFGASAHNIMIT